VSSILVVCHTSEDQTTQVANQIGAVLRERGDHVEVHDVAGAPAPEHFDGVVVGDSIQALHHSRAVTRYVRDHVDVLNARPAALFQVSLSQLVGDVGAATAQHLVHDLLDRTEFDPDLVGVFAGALVYTRYGWFQRRVMRAVNRRDDEIDLTLDTDYTDWSAVEQFARDVHALVQATEVAAS
jgi:menaquinone-dependent protoporphyrinogen oxidase